jgi:GNAT superfamily N-acetyltransferase
MTSILPTFHAAIPTNFRPVSINQKIAQRIRLLFKTIPMDLRPAVIEDIPDLVRLRIEFLKVDRPAVNALKEGLLALSLANYFMRHLGTGDLVCWVAIGEGKIVGGAGICFNHYPPNFQGMEEEMAQLINLYTLPGHRDEDLEQQVFARLLEEAEKRNVSLITVQDAEMGKGGNKNFVLYKK